MTIIRNPILRGFNPDPSIVRVDGDYFIATSTFEWFPGVQIHHSRDLVHWRLLTRPLDRTSLLDMTGVPNSGGIWAPCLTWDAGRFYLAYTNVKELNSATKDTPNYLTTATDILGPWEEPIFLNASGFDPSLFHDDDGRKWLVNMVWDHRPEKHPFHGIVLQEYDASRRKLVGESRLIFKGTALGRTEAPHLYKRNGYYYLMTAEGGTGYEHAVTLARSRSIAGPYEVHPSNPILTSWGDQSLPLQKAGHADILETQDGEWYLVHLAARPIQGTDRCILGRETAIQKVEWGDDDWLHLHTGSNRPQLEVPAPGLTSHPWPAPEPRDDFDASTLSLHFQSSRTPLTEQSMSLTERPGYLRLFGGQSLESKFDKVMAARRLQTHQAIASTVLEFDPTSFQHIAGLVCYYSTRLFHFLCMSFDEQVGRCLYVQSADDGVIHYPLSTAVIPLGNATRVHLKAHIDQSALTFSYSLDGESWQRVCENLDASILSDDYGTEWGFTGAFVGMACLDLTGHRKPADFDYFSYEEWS